MAKGNDKGFLTWVFTIINLVIGAGVSIGLVSGAITGLVNGDNNWAIGLLIVAILDIMVGVWFVWRSVMIILGIASNSWAYVIVSFFISAIIGGVLMLIAKLLN